ncbi:MAG TPA: hypothetical protein VLB89_08580 [Gaiellaceae bacterium]|nr:hypothetical protein [Gaiellaceae bacterium]
MALVARVLNRDPAYFSKDGVIAELQSERIQLQARLEQIEQRLEAIERILTENVIKP